MSRLRRTRRAIWNPQLLHRMTRHGHKTWGSQLILPSTSSLGIDQRFPKEAPIKPVHRHPGLDPGSVRLRSRVEARDDVNDQCSLSQRGADFSLVELVETWTTRR